jgi:hypothetical protein
MASSERSLASDAFFPSLLIASVYGLAASQLFGRGANLSLDVCAVAVTALLLRHRGGLRVDRPLGAVLALAALLFVQGHLVSEVPAEHARISKTLLWTALTVVALTMAAVPAYRVPRLPAGWIASLPVLYVVLQAGAYSLHYAEAGLFDNIHYPALYAVLTLPVLFHFAVTIQNPWRGLFVLALLGDTALLLKTQSRPGFLALAAAALVTLPFLSPRVRWASCAGLLGVPGVLYAAGWFGFSARMNDLAVNFFKDERFTLWRETVQLQGESAFPQWLFGHGFGGFFWNYRLVSSFYPRDDLSFPHNFFLEVLYSHGVIGLILVPAAYALFFRKLVLTITATADPSRRRIGVLLLSLNAAHLVDTFLTQPLFSRPTLFSLGLILGASLYFFRTACHD